MLDGFNCFLPEVRALPFARQSTPVGGFLRVQGWGTANDTSRGGVRARVSAPISVAFFRAIIERGASMGSRQRPRGSSRVRARATAPRPRVFSPIFPPSVLTPPLCPLRVQPYKFSTATDAKEAAQVRPSARPVPPSRAPGTLARGSTRDAFFFPRVSRGVARRPPQIARASRRATAPAGCLSFALGCSDFNPPPSGGRRARLGARRALLGRPD